MLDVLRTKFNTPSYLLTIYLLYYYLLGWYAVTLATESLSPTPQACDDDNSRSNAALHIRLRSVEKQTDFLGIVQLLSRRCP